MKGATVTDGDEIVAIHAGFQRALLPVEGGGPRVVRIGWRAPGAVLPHYLHIAVVEGGQLRVGNVRLAALAPHDATARSNALRPAQVHHPARHVEHVYAHVAHDAVAVLHEGAPAARMHDGVVGAHGRRSGPHVVVE